MGRARSDLVHQYFAQPARRFDEAPLCNGQPCHHGVVTSICAGNYASALRPFLDAVGNGY